MTTAYDELESLLRSCHAAPFLFVGSGLSRRYLGFDDWEGLLKRMAACTSRPYGYYRSAANGDLPAVASEIAKEFHPLWWSADEFAASRAMHGDGLKSPQGPLKVEVARYFEDGMTAWPTAGPEAHELELLSHVVVDGVITTNYDRLLERTFSDFVPYIGQDELLFADSTGIGEIYKIHGSSARPESIVLTSEDYEQFGERNPYLAAKLLTIFVEHPVVFLGYSLSDENITSILISIARVLTSENLERLRDRLIFVPWRADQAQPVIGSAQIAVPGFTIPVVSVTVSTFDGLYEVLARMPRRFPARQLRLLKKSVYDLVLSRDPQNRLTVVPFEDDTRADQIDVVFGVGVQKLLTEQGYVGLEREDLLLDTLRAESAYNPKLVIDQVLPRKLRNATYVPVYRYLRGADVIADDATMRPEVTVDGRVAGRVNEGSAPLLPNRGWATQRATQLAADVTDFHQLATNYGLDDVLLGVLALPRERIDLNELRDYLYERRDSYHDRKLITAWAKAVCYYDYHRYGDIG